MPVRRVGGDHWALAAGQEGTGEVAPRPSPGRTPNILRSAQEREALWQQLEASPEATLEEHRQAWERERGVWVSRELIEQRGCELLFLPSFSPIEEAFSKLKALLRMEKARTKEALVEAIGRLLVAITPGDALGWFGHCGYTLSNRSL